MQLTKLQYAHLTGLLLALLWMAACQPQPPGQVFIEVDGNRLALTTESGTVREALDEAGVELGKLDRVKPDLYTRLEPGLTVVVTRVTEEVEVKREVIPFERQTVVNEALAPGETRMAQLGANGEDEISTRVVYENGQEVSRTEISRVTVIQPVPEIMVIGPKDTLPSVQVDGTIAYTANGNAWLMRSTSSSRRALTTHGKLDGRAFDLSPDSRRLIYTVELTNEIEMPLNEMMLASTTIVGEPPITTGVRGVLQAAWSPVISQSRVAYTTAERSPNPPGWQANNDLWLLDVVDGAPAKPVEIIPANTRGLYPWWGTSFTWSPDGQRLAYARADQIGVVELITGTRTISAALTPLLDFTPLDTFSDWVWVPQVSWSPDGQFVAAVVHGPPLAGEAPEESQIFDLWLLSADGSLSAKVADNVGMWANPVWGPAGVAFGRALNPLQSVNSRYAIELVDRDGSNRRRIFPFSDEPGVQFPELAWSPDGQELLFVYNGNLHLTRSSGGVPKPLSADGQADHPRWGMTAPLQIISPTTAITATPPVSVTTTPAATETSTATATFTPAPTGTPTARATRTATATRTRTPSATPTRAVTRTATVTPTRTRTPSSEN